ncbi:MAG: tRNA-intron lyase [Candidatus Bathyarchaeota archaeon]|jgi:tRNA-intron endonuclease|nr:tRNA-intron lyase [Candidatus Bathyarchaeota archaeon A05DMB-3]MDH7606808.1 tRNA-intron lyase [Candidatus Bathyarchaeota archaeon]
MSKNKEQPPRTEAKTEGYLTEKGVKITSKQKVDELQTRGYGVNEDGELLLNFYEALYLLDKGLLEVKSEEDAKIDFQRLLQISEKTDENAWGKYLVYRDLRSRGYVVREGFGLGVDFRVYERGEYGKDTAKYLILSLQEGKPITLEELTQIMRQCQSLKKELILAVMSRRGEIVYYSVSQLTLP